MEIYVNIREKIEIYFYDNKCPKNYLRMDGQTKTIGRNLTIENEQCKISWLPSCHFKQRCNRNPIEWRTSRRSLRRPKLIHTIARFL